MIKRSIKGVWRLTAYAVITLAIVLAILRFTFPYLNRYIPEIEASLSEKLHAEVHIAGLRANWRGHGPQLTLQNFTLVDPNSKNMVLTLKRFYADLDIWRSVISFKPVMREFELNGLRATIELDEQGRIVLPGLQLNNSESDLSAEYLIDLLMRQREVAIVDTLINYRRHDGETVALDLPEMRLRNYVAMHQASGDLRVEQGGTAGFVFEFSDYPLAADDQMSLYVESRKLDLARLPFSTQSLGFNLDSGILELKLWAQWRNNSWRSGETEVALKDVQFSNAQKHKKTINELTSHLWLQRDKNNEWRIDGDRNQVRVDKKNYPNLSVQAHIHRQNDGQRWAIDIGELEAEQGLEWLLFSSQTPPKLREKLQQWQAQAHIPLIQVDVQTHDDRANDWALAAQIENIQYQAIGLPSLQNFNARFALNNSMAALRLQSRDSSIDFHEVFREPLALQSLDLAANWSFDDPQPIFFVPYLQVNNSDAEVFARGRFDVSEQGAHELSLQAQLTRADIANKSKYLPVSVMSASLTEYLDKSIISGQLSSAWASLRGPLPQLASHSALAAFAIEGHIEQTQYRFDSAWPVTRNIDSRLRFIDDSMQIDLARAKLLDVTILPTQVAIAHLRHQAELTISGAAALSGDSAQTLIDASPLREWIAAVPATLKLAGDFETQLNLTIPLGQSGEVSLDGQIHLNDNAVTLKPINLVLPRVHGDLRFTEHGLHSGKLRGDGLGGDWQAQIRSDDNGAEIAFAGQLDTTVAQEWQFHPLRKRITGRTAYRGHVEMPRHDGHVSVHLNSDLEGVKVDLPAPYGKSSDEHRASQLNVSIGKQQVDLSALYGEHLQMESVSVEGGAWRTEMLLEGAEYIGDRDGFTIRGQLAELTLQQWLSVVANLEHDPQQVSGEANFKSAPQMVLLLKKANLFGENFSDVAINAYGDKLYHIDLASRDLTGSVAVPTSGPLQIELQQLRFGQRAEVKDTTLPPAEDPALMTIEPKDVPELLLHCRQCSVWGYDLGEVNAQFNNDDHNKKIQVKAKKTDILSAELNGSWRLNSGTELNGELSSKNFGKLFELWQVTSDIQDTPGQIGVAMKWTGSPFDYTMRRLHLETDIDWDSGYLKIVTDQKNVARLLSLTSLQTITRRLTLDFRDLYKDGFFYDGIEGHFSLHGGVAHTDNLVIDGTSAVVELKGDANLLNRTLDQRALINPKIDSIGTIALWVLNPAVGAFSWLTSKIWAPKVRVLAQQEMSISGSFDNPVVVEGKRVEKEIELSDEEKAEAEKQAADKAKPKDVQ